MSATGESGPLTQPDVSVVIPAYNAERYLGEAIESVLAQSLQPSEVIVVDDGSTDGTAAIASSYGPPVRCVSHGKVGLAATLNAGVAAATGELLGFVDADDLWCPGKQEAQAAALAADPALDGVFGQVKQFRSPELTPAERESLALPPEDQRGLAKGAMLIRRSSFLRVGPFATEWTLGEFIDWYARAVDAGLKFMTLPDVVLRRRLHRTNTGIVARDSRLDYVRILRAVVDRRQEQAG
jgi:glycosyltransferase involved in cell wall biosynthesis